MTVSNQLDCVNENDSYDHGETLSGFKKKRFYTRDFIVWILKRYGFPQIRFYVGNAWHPSSTYKWGRDRAMPIPLLQLIHKDILIARLCGRIPQEDCKSLDELFEDYLESKDVKSKK